MSHLSKLSLSTASPTEPIGPVARKRMKLIRKIDQQIDAAQAEANDELFVEEIRRWVRNEETGEKQLVTQQRPIRRWWWQNSDGQWMVSLRDGNRLIRLDGTNRSAIAGDKSDIVMALEVLRDAAVGGELDDRLEELIGDRKIPQAKRAKPPAKPT